MKSNKARLIGDQRGVIGLVLLAAVLVGTMFVAGYYVYQVRTGGSTSLTGNEVKATTPAEVKADADAAAADAAGRAAENEKMTDIGVGDNDF